MNEEVWQILRKRGAIRILIELKNRGRSRLTDLKNWTRLDYTVLSRRLADLRKLKLIERKPGFKNKRRCVFYTLTNQGKELARKLKRMTVEEFVETLRLS